MTLLHYQSTVFLGSESQSLVMRDEASFHVCVSLMYVLVVFSLASGFLLGDSVVGFGMNVFF